MRRLACIAVLASVLGAATGCRATRSADLVLRNGVIYTNVESSPRVQALAVKSGRIVYAGSIEGVEP